MTFHSQLDAWNDLLQALVFGLQAEILPAQLIVAMPMLGLDAAAAALDAEGAEHFAAADAALLTRLFSMLDVEMGRYYTCYCAYSGRGLGTPPSPLIINDEQK